MLEHRYRFHGHGSVRRLYQHGDTVRQRAVTLRYRKNPSRVHSRVTIVVAKKVFKAATKRNRIRRRIYEIVRRHWNDLEQPYDIAIIVFDGATMVIPHEELEAVVLQLLNEAGLVKKAD
ncbi:ribonuclease P protein component [Candidatus Saccharibacteria bacterium]|nr:MAG: ribonuclease P protein component [Candidatus Saccharibacteria bacterium]